MAEHTEVRGWCDVCGHRRLVAYRGWHDEGAPMRTCRGCGLPPIDRELAAEAVVKAAEKAFRVTMQIRFLNTHEKRAYRDLRAALDGYAVASRQAEGADGE